MARLEPKHGFTVKGWMNLDLGLKGWELVIFAIVHQFTEKSGSYTGGIPYICAFTGLTRNSVRKYLRSLEAKGLIVCHLPVSNSYTSVKRGSKVDREGGQILTGEGSNLDTEGVKSCAVGGQILTPDIKDINIKEKGNSAKRIVSHPSIEDVTAFATELGYADPAGFAKDYITYNEDRDWIGGNGKPIRNWKNHIRNNCKWAKDKIFPKDETVTSRNSTRFEMDVL